METHPFIIWWQKDGYKEDTSHSDTWDAAIEEAAKCIIEDGNPLVALDKIKKLKFSEEKN